MVFLQVLHGIFTFQCSSLLHAGFFEKKNEHFIAFSSKRQRRRNTSPNFICLRSGPQFAEKVFEMNNFSEGLAKKKYLTKIQI